MSANRLFVTQSGLTLRKMYRQALRGSRVFRVMACAEWIEIFNFSFSTNDGNFGMLPPGTMHSIL
ncbi:hypothetical protein BAE36_13670 [Rhizobium leguminosarum bv. trifolii]|nr:hypothetical protein CHR56_27385 [Rhizobium leguminosarum bv. viciae]OBY06649.1 hypothetical protein BAE36_13670 [Rhizobium leguminosarum bv. trifolii]OOO45890.1 hypothetical protein BS629_21785 [Rhizobium leguminosarum bv. viciae USDA 2370]PUB65747.1 hypothetical protein DB728_04795 [Rhizobium leguminosarum bv. viciae USDA 2370]